jgi:transposase
MSRVGSSKAGRRARRQFTDEFMAGAVRLVLDEGKTVGAVARDLDLTPSSLANWVRHARADRTKGRTGLTTAEREELARLRKENRILAEERDILKKAAAASTSRRNTASDSSSWRMKPQDLPRAAVQPHSDHVELVLGEG